MNQEHKTKISWIVDYVAIVDSYGGGWWCSPFETMCLFIDENQPAASQFNLENPPFNMDLLDKIAHVIETRRLNKINTIIYCYDGLERSPLVVAWWLYRVHHFDLDTAFRIIRLSKPEIIDRREWISAGASL